MMQPMTEGMNLNPEVLIAVQNERLAGGAIREAQLTAAVQQLTMENMQLKEQALAVHEAAVEEEDASTDDSS